MIAGTIIIEDSILQFQHDADAGAVLYTVADAQSGKRSTQLVPMDAFFTALAYALSTDECESIAKLPPAVSYQIAESAMPLDPVLRWIP